MGLRIWRTCFLWHFFTLVPKVVTTPHFFFIRSGLGKCMGAFQSLRALVICRVSEYFGACFLNLIFDTFVCLYVLPKMEDSQLTAFSSFEKKSFFRSIFWKTRNKNVLLHFIFVFDSLFPLPKQSFRFYSKRPDKNLLNSIGSGLRWFMHNTKFSLILKLLLPSMPC